jgi:hypothetical protein
MKSAAGLLALIGALAVTAGGGCAWAQQTDREMELGSRISRPKPADIPDYPGMSDTDRARATAFQFAQCIVVKQRRRADAHFAMKRDDPQSNDVLRKLADNDCLRYGELRVPLELLRGAIFRSAYLSQFPHMPTKLATTAVDFDTYLSDPKGASIVQYRILMDFADCVVRADFPNSDKIVRSEPGSPQENAALAALMPSLGPCMVSGFKVTLNRSVVSAVLSEALYREGLAAVAGGISG